MRYGFDYITSGNYAGDWQELFFPVDSVVTLTTNKGDSFSGVTFSKGQSIVGPYEGISVTSGAVIAYKRSDTEKRSLFTGLLDTYGGAAAAYSLRKLSADYTGSAIRVRESATSTEADIGFNPDGTLDTTALLAHTGSNDGYVVTWYDQSGNARNATQATASAQPQIVSSGSVVLENGQAAVSFDGVDDKLKSSFTTLTQPNTIFSLASTTDLSSTRLLYDDDDGSDRNTLSVEAAGGGSIAAFAGSALLGTAWSVSTSTIHTVLYNSTLSLIHRNGTQIASGDVGTQGLSGFTIGSRFSGSYWQGKIQEITVYPSDQSSNRTAIESNINDFYSIYP